MGAAAPLKFRFETPTANLGLTELRVTPGVIDDMAREFFLDGMCHMLAMAIHEMTGWELGVVERRHPSSGEWGWCHLGVWCPTGYPNFLDIKGRREPGEVIADAEQFGGPVRIQAIWQPADQEERR